MCVRVFVCMYIYVYVSIYIISMKYICSVSECKIKPAGLAVVLTI